MDKQRRLLAIALATGEHWAGRGLTKTWFERGTQILSLAPVLALVDPMVEVEFWNRWGDALGALLREDWQLAESGQLSVFEEALQELVDLLDNYSPPGYRFASHPITSEWGWWTEEEIEWA